MKKTAKNNQAHDRTQMGKTTNKNQSPPKEKLWQEKADAIWMYILWGGKPPEGIERLKPENYAESRRVLISELHPKLNELQDFILLDGRPPAPLDKLPSNLLCKLKAEIIDFFQENPAKFREAFWPDQSETSTGAFEEEVGRILKALADKAEHQTQIVQAEARAQTWEDKSPEHAYQEMKNAGFGKKRIAEILTDEMRLTKKQAAIIMDEGKSDVGDSAYNKRIDKILKPPAKKS